MNAILACIAILCMIAGTFIFSQGHDDSLWYTIPALFYFVIACFA